MHLSYACGEEPAKGDTVEDNYLQMTGTVSRIFPKSERAMVTFAAGRPNQKIASVPVNRLTLLRRDG